MEGAACALVVAVHPPSHNVAALLVVPLATLIDV